MANTPKNLPRWLCWVVPLVLVLDSVLVRWVRLGAKAGDADWWNVGVQIALAVLLFWYVLETRRVANETQGMKRQSEEQLSQLREEHRTAHAAVVVPSLLNFDREDVPNETPNYIRQRAARINEAMGAGLAEPTEDRILRRQIRVSLEGDNLAQDLTILLKFGSPSIGVKERAVDLLTPRERTREIEIEGQWKAPEGWRSEAEVRSYLVRYGFPLSVISMVIARLWGSGVAVCFRDVVGTPYVVVRPFTQSDGLQVEHSFFERIT